MNISVYKYLMLTIFFISLGCESRRPTPKSCLGSQCENFEGVPIDHDQIVSREVDSVPFDQLSETNKQLVLTHNEYRSDVGVPSLTWSQELTNVAENWAQNLINRGCGLVHRPNGNFGENLFSSTGAFYSPKEVVSAWGDEKADYNYQSNRCKSGRVCGHYTQVVWKSTTHIGCASARCNGNAEVWVCNYNPPGNYIGMRPY